MMMMVAMSLVISGLLLVICPATLGDAAESTFSVFWNSPSQSCYKIRLDRDLDQFEIKYNPGLSFKGSNITLIYADYSKLGAFPYINSKKQEVNGGIPQRANISLHLEKVEKQIKSSLSANFDGLAVIDFEHWRPRYERNWSKNIKKYKEKSNDYVEERFPNLTTNEIKAKAREEFNLHAMKLLNETIKLASRLRPKAQWGYYKLPDCHNYNYNTPLCGSYHESLNDKLSWMWNASDALFPSAYFGIRWPADFQAKKNFVRGQIEEAFRVAKLPNTTLPVYLYMRIGYTKTVFASREDLEAAMEQAADLGAAGVILWDSSRRFKDRSYCSRLKSNVQTLLGPFAKRVIEEARNCSESLCNSRGRCALADSRTLTPRQNVSVVMNRRGKDFRCRCFNGWKGERCEEECYNEPRGVDYRGTKNVTLSGRTCQRWSSQKPHRHLHIKPSIYPNSGLQENYCRNPKTSYAPLGSEGGPWCYTTDSNKRWEHCLPLCKTSQGSSTKKLAASKNAARSNAEVIQKTEAKWDDDDDDNDDDKNHDDVNDYDHDKGYDEDDDDNDEEEGDSDNNDGHDNEHDDNQIYDNEDNDNERDDNEDNDNEHDDNQDDDLLDENGNEDQRKRRR